jgi:sulfur transfer protein SufE
MTEKLAKVVEMFRSMADSEMRSMLLIDFADKYQEVPSRIAERPFPEESRVPYCESEAYVWLEPVKDDRVKLHFAVENPSGISAKALSAILDETLSGEEAETVAKLNPDIIYDIFGRQIGMGKGQGLMALAALVQSKAQKIAAGSSKQ